MSSSSESSSSLIVSSDLHDNLNDPKSGDPTDQDGKDFETSNTGAKSSNLMSFGFPTTFGKAIKGQLNQRKDRLSDQTVDSSGVDSVTLALQGMIQTSRAPKVTQNEVATTEISTAWEKLNWKRKDDDDFDSRPLLPAFFIPREKSVSLTAHERSVTAMAINPKGSRLATGGHDAEVRLWDFNGMSSNHDSFRRFTPISGHGIRALSYSPTGSHFVCAAGDAMARIYDVDGNQLQMTVKGDMYVRDLSNTKGHTHGLSDCQWHPYDKEKFLTSSMDATVRIFDINSKPWGIDQSLPHLHILKAVDKRNLNIAGQCHVTAARWAPCSAKFVIGGCGDGSLQLWNEKKVYSKPDKIVRSAHTSEVTGLTVFQDDIRIVSRSRDCSMKRESCMGVGIWDIRKFKDPVHIWNELENDVSGLAVCLSPDQTMIATGIDSSSGSAAVHIFNTSTFEPICVIPISSDSPRVDGPTRTFAVGRILWPESLDQLVLGCTDGSVRILYDSVHSTKGALLFAGRQMTKRKVDDDLKCYNQPVYTMDTLPLGIRETREGEVRRVKLREQDKPVERRQKTKIPPMPSGREGMGGQRATHGSLSAHIMGQINISSTRDEDPVEALRAYAQKTEDEPIFISQAYQISQPKAVLDYTPEQGQDELLVQNVSKCPRCGLKMCQCGYMTLQDSIKGPVQKQRRVE